MSDQTKPVDEDQVEIVAGDELVEAEEAATTDTEFSQTEHQDDTPTQAPVASVSRRGMGIGARLLFSVLVIFGTTVAAIAVGWYSMGVSSRTLSAITDVKAPAMADALRLAETVSRITSIAPAMIAAKDNVARGEVDELVKNSGNQ